MTKFTLLLLIALAALAATAPAAPIPDVLKEPALFFPTTVGARWTYKCPWGDEVLAVSRVDREDGAQVVSVSRVRKGGEVTPYEKVRVSPQGLYQHEAPSSVYAADRPDTPLITFKTDRVEWVAPDYNVEARERPVCLLKLPATAGEVWVARFSRIYAAACKSGPREGVVVPAGAFLASTVDLTFTNHSDPTRPLRCRFWYAPGVGPVKWTTIDGDEVVLKAFSPGRP